MAARAIVTRYGTEALLTNGNFSIQWWALVIDPVLFQSNDIHGCICTDVVELDASNPASWSGTVEASVIAQAAALPVPFTLTAANVFIPTIA